MVLAHLLTVSAFNGGRIVGRFHPQYVAGVLQRRAALRLLPATATELLLITAAKLCAPLHHAQELIELSPGNTQLFGNHIQHFTLVGMQRTIGKRRLNLNFKKHANKIEAAKTDATKLAHFFT